MTNFPTLVTGTLALSSACGLKRVTKYFSIFLWQGWTWNPTTFYPSFANLYLDPSVIQWCERKTLISINKFSKIDSSLLTAALLVSLPSFCVLIYPTSIVNGNNLSQRFQIYHHAFPSYFFFSSGISPIVFNVSHGFSVRRLQAFTQAEVKESQWST